MFGAAPKSSPLGDYRRGRASQAGQQPARPGFTLIELMVVVAIIAVLVALLVPALSAAKRRARYVDNESLLTGIANAAEAYDQDFNGFPGPPIPGADTASSNKMSGSQALLLALSYAWVDSSDTSSTDPNSTASIFGIASGPPLVTYQNITVDPAKVTGPLDHSNTTPTGAFRSYKPYFTPGSRELSPTVPPGGNVWPSSGVVPAFSANQFQFPTIIDHYPVPMPLLYFRATPGTAGAVTFNGYANGQSDALSNMSQSNPPLVSEDPSTPATFYRYENVEYIQSKGFVTSLGTSPDQTQYSPFAINYDGSQPGDHNKGNSGDPARTDLRIAKYLTGTTGTGTMNGPTHFVLISAGEDRIYGTADDVIIKR